VGLLSSGCVDVPRHISSQRRLVVFSLQILGRMRWGSCEVLNVL
jgi:hypothetical protein